MIRCQVGAASENGAAGSAPSGGMHIKPWGDRPKSWQEARKTGSSSARIPAFCGSSPVLTWMNSCGLRSVLVDLGGKLAGQAHAVQGVDGVEQSTAALGLVGLQRPDHVQFHAGVTGPPVWPLFLCLLHVVFAKDALPRVQHGRHTVLRLHLADRDQRDAAGRASGPFFCRRMRRLMSSSPMMRQDKKKRAGARPALKFDC